MTPAAIILRELAWADAQPPDARPCRESLAAMIAAALEAEGEPSPAVLRARPLSCANPECRLPSNHSEPCQFGTAS